MIKRQHDGRRRTKARYRAAKQWDCHRTHHLAIEALEQRTLLDGKGMFSDLVPIGPAGTLVYAASGSGDFVLPGEIDGFSISLDGGQRMSIQFSSQQAELAARLTLRGPDDSVLGCVDGGAGEHVVLPPIETGLGGAFTVDVESLDGVGSYQLELLLNAAFEAERTAGTNDVLTRAEDLAATSIPLQGAADHLAVKGGMSSLADTMVAVPTWSPILFAIDRQTGASAEIATFDNLGEAYWSDIEADTGGVLYGSLYNRLFALDTAGNAQLLGWLDMPTEALEYDPLHSVLYAVQGTVFGTIDFYPEDLVVFTPIGDTGYEFISGLAFRENTAELFAITAGYRDEDHVGDVPSYLLRIDTETGAAELIHELNYIGYDALDFAPDGTLYAGLGYYSAPSYLRGGLLTIDLETGFESEVGDTGLSEGVAGLTYIPGVSDAVDCYHFTLEAGQAATIAALADLPMSLQLFDAAGQSLVQGTNAGASSVIRDYVSSTGGTYYVGLNNETPARNEYTLTVLRGASLGWEPNDTPASAQEIGTSGQVAAKSGTIVSGPLEGLRVPLPQVLNDGGETAWIVYEDNVGLHVPYSHLLYALRPYSGMTVSESRLSDDGQQIAMTGSITRKVYAHPDYAWVRCLDIFTNDTNEAHSYSWSPQSRVRASYPLKETSSGDTTFDTNDNWLIIGQSASSRQFLFVTQSPGGQVPDYSYLQERPSGNSYTNIINYWNFSLAPGESTAIISFLATGEASELAALRTIGQHLAAGGLDALDGLTPCEKAILLNWPSEDPVDYYHVNAQEENVLKISITAPGGEPYLPENPLIPIVELISPTGVSLGSFATSFSYQVPLGEGGEYTLRVAPASGRGNYSLRVDGATGAIAPVQVIDTSVRDGEVLTAWPDDLAIDFSGELLQANITPDVLRINGQPAEWVEAQGSTLTFGVTSLSNGDGAYTVNITTEALQSVRGTGVQPAQLNFTLDTTPPTVIHSSIAEGQAVSPGLVTIELQFSEPLDGSLLNYKNFTREPSSIAYDPASQTATLVYNNLSEGAYTLGINGLYIGNPLYGDPPYGAVRDMAGNVFGTTGDLWQLHFLVDVDVAPVNNLNPLTTSPLVHQTYLSGNFFGEGDVDAYTVDLFAGQQVSLGNRWLQPNTKMRIELVGPDEQTVGSAVAPDVGQPVLLQGVSAPETGQYTIRLISESGGGQGSYTIHFYVNAQQDISDYGIPNTSIETAQDLDAGFVQLPGGASYTGLADFGWVGNDLTFGRVTLGPGQSLSVLGGAELLDAGGTVVGRGGETQAELGYALLDFVSPTGGVYYVHGSASMLYRGVAPEVTYSREAGNIQPLQGNPAAIGNLAAPTMSCDPDEMPDAGWPGLILGTAHGSAVKAVSAPQASTGSKVFGSQVAGQWTASWKDRTLRAWLPTGIRQVGIDAVALEDGAQATLRAYVRISGVEYVAYEVTTAPLRAGIPVTFQVPTIYDNDLYRIEVSGIGGDVLLDNLVIGGDASDEYEFAAGEGLLEIETATPNVVPGTTSNNMDLRLSLYDPTGALVAADDNSAADHRNARIAYLVPDGKAGAYTVRVEVQEGSGPYLIWAGGTASSADRILAVTSTDPADGYRTRYQLSRLVLNFNEGYDSATAQPEDLVIDGGAVVTGIEGYTSSGTTLIFNLDVPDVESTYHWSLAAGALNDVQGNPSAPFSGTFIIDRTGPVLVGLEPSQVAAPFQEITLVFDEDLNPNRVQPADVTSFINPNGVPVAVQTCSVVDGNKVRIQFTQQTVYGTYNLTIGPNINDIADNPMAAAWSGQIQAVSPDLEVVEVIAPPAGFTMGASAVVSWTVRNTGTDPAAESWWADLIYLSQDQTLGGGDLLIHQREIYASPLEALHEYQRSAEVNFRDPSLFTGTWYLIVKTDAYGQQPEHNETNNTLAVPVLLSVPPQPDLVVTDILAPLESVDGESIVVSWTLTNVGDAPAVGPWTDVVRLARDAEGGGLQQLGTVEFNGVLEPGESVTRTQTLALPLALQGEFWMTVEPDVPYYVAPNTPFGQVYEHGHEENLAVDDRSMMVRLAPRPNLVVSEVTVPPETFGGSEIAVEWIVRNSGTGSTNATCWYDHIYLCDAAGTAWPQFLKSVPNVSYLNAGESYAASATVQLPIVCPERAYILVVTDAGDYGGNVYEGYFEGDNGRQSETMTIHVPPTPDLTVAVSAPTEVFSGEKIYFSWTVTNEGEARATGLWTDIYFLSPDMIIGDENDIWGGWLYGSNVSPGESYTKTGLITMPNGIEGQYYLFVGIDSHNEVFEHLDEGNNIGFTTIQVHLAPPPDLIVENVNARSKVVSAGDTITVSYEIVNQGTADSEGYRSDRVWLSRNAYWDMNDTLVADVTRDEILSTDERIRRSIDVVVPSDAIGEYYVLVGTNVNQNLYEVDYTNNFGVDAVPINVVVPLSDLVVTSVHVEPDDAIVGDGVLVEWTITNNGPERTSSSTWIDTVLLATSSTLEDDIELIQYVHSGVLGLGATAVHRILVELPNVPTGDYYLFVHTNSSYSLHEYDGNNVSQPVPIRITRLLPDPAVTWVDVPATASSTEGLPVSWRVDNGTNRPVNGGLTDSVWLSLDTTLDSVDVSLGGRTEAELVGNGHYEKTSTFSLPLDFEGEYYVLVKNDSANDGDLSNNVAVSPHKVLFSLGPLPDLVVSQVDAPTEAHAGQPMYVAWTVRNNGEPIDDQVSLVNGVLIQHKLWTDKIYLSQDHVLDASDTYIGYADRRGDGLDHGEEANFSISANIPPGLSGLYYVLVQTDANGSISERSGESNNVGLDPYAVLVHLAPPADLVAGVITVPEIGVPGMGIRIEYTVANAGPGDVIGRWYDALYLSTDETWDVYDTYLGRVQGGSYSPDPWGLSGVSAGGSYTGVFYDVLAGVRPGDYHVIVRSDILNHIRESNEANNLSASLDVVQVDFDELTLGTPTEGIFLVADQPIYYQLNTTAGKTVRLTLEVGHESAAAELFVRYDDVPTRARYDYAYSQPFSPHQVIDIPQTLDGTYYVMVYAPWIHGEDFTILAEYRPFAVEAIEPGLVGTAGPVTLALDGAELGESMKYELVSPQGTAYRSTAALLEDATRAYVTFDLAGAVEGDYTLRISRDDGESISAATTVHVRPGGGARLEADLQAPGQVRIGGSATIVLEYANTGDVDLVAPIFNVIAEPDLWLGLAGHYDGEGNLQVLGASPDGPRGILRPGMTHRVAIDIPTVPAGSYELALEYVDTSGNDPAGLIVDWKKLEPYYASPFGVGDAWDWTWRVFTSQMGQTWDQVALNLADRVQQEPYSDDGAPNILVKDLMLDALADAAGTGGGLLDWIAPTVLTHWPVAVAGLISAVDVVFSEIIDAASFLAEELQMFGPGGNSIGPLTVSQQAPNVYRLGFAPQQAAGKYQLLIPPMLRDLADNLLDQDRDSIGGMPTDGYDAGFVLNAAGHAAPGLYVVSHTVPFGYDHGSGVDRVLVNFSQPPYFKTFGPQDVSIFGPAGEVAIHSVSQVTSTTYEVRFDRQEALGDYHVWIGPNVALAAGTPMDQNVNGQPGEVLDAYDAAFHIGDAVGPRVVGHTPNDYMAEPVSAIDVTFDEPVDPETFTTDLAIVVGPEGPVTVQEVSVVAGTDDRTFRISILEQKAGGQYVLSIGPNVRDVFGNAMDQDQDYCNGTVTDVYVSTFGLLAGVNLAYPDETVTVATKTSSSDFTANVAIKGRIVYDSTSLLGQWFPDGAHVTVQLWEQDGARDQSILNPSDGDPLDDLIATTNVYTGYGWTSVQGYYLFEKDIQGNPILNLDTDEIDNSDPANPKPKLAEYYVVVLARNELAHVVKGGTHTIYDPGVESKPWFTPLHPVPGTEGYPYSENPPAGVQFSWGQLYYADISLCGSSIMPAATRQNELLVQTLPDLAIANLEFGLAEWIYYAANWISYYAGQPPRRPIATVYPELSNPDNAMFTSRDIIFIGTNALTVPGVVLHEYGHSLQFAANNYQWFPYYGDQNSITYGVIQESNHQAVAFAEAWASFVAARTLYGKVTPNHGAPLERVDYNRSGQWMDSNSFWMAWDGYGYANNSIPDDFKIDSLSLANILLTDGINDNANTGDWVLGGIESIFWDLADNNNDDHVFDLRGLWQSFLASAGSGYLWGDFHYHMTQLRPSIKSDIDAIFIDHGIPVADDEYEAYNGKENDTISTALDLSRDLFYVNPLVLDGLIMAEQEKGDGDWFKINIPAKDKPESAEGFKIRIDLEFKPEYGDLDLTMVLFQGGQQIGQQQIDRARGNGKVVIKSERLYTDEEYTLYVGVAGHGALKLLAETTPDKGGDYHPHYKLSIGTYDPDDPEGEETLTKKIDTVASLDPNEIIGPNSYGPEHWVPADTPLPYTIYFENDPTATAPAQEITVEQYLDPDLDWRTFRLGEFGWGNLKFHPPENRAFYSERLDLRSTLGFFVDVAAGVDARDGRIFWHLTTIDPLTGAVPADPAIGFLPVNNNLHIGEGFVSYTVEARADAITETIIDAQATIIFDTNGPIDTPAIFHTLDAETPGSVVANLPPVITDEVFPVHWNWWGETSGSGFRGCDVYVSVNGGVPQPWLKNTFLTEALYAGQSGNHYAFYSVARDNAGNVEDLGQLPDTATSVVFDVVPPSVAGTLVQGGLSQRSYVDRIQIDFTEQMNLAELIANGSITSAISLINLGVNTNLDPDLPVPLSANQFQYEYDEEAGVSRLMWSLDAFAASNTSLADGYYKLVLDASRITDVAGNPLDADGDGAGGDDFVFRFHRLQGDADGNRVVNAADMAIVNAALGAMPTSSTWNANADLDRDARVSVRDRLIVARATGNQIFSPSSRFRTPIPLRPDDFNGRGSGDQQTNRLVARDHVFAMLTEIRRDREWIL